MKEKLNEVETELLEQYSVRAERLLNHIRMIYPAITTPEADSILKLYGEDARRYYTLGLSAPKT